ncbi:repressor LexA [candidate division KSB3 bacterium]|uniref:Repressor LexA n=1 Tax=candidate division KSB3 bacterium TaxID=2044937 RepID=A0A2G6E1B7_9BACT|nr:MAG: repressor LexA [candidate division KSB3 bacterium]PIE28529.1 MAG: repressor LexA [candidate division KSB3 bacterium]
MERQTLYTKEKATLEYIKDYMFERQVAPSLEEIRSHFGKKSLATIHKSLGQLEEKGYIERNKHHNRSITLTDQTLEFFGLKPLNSLPLLGTVKAGRGILNFEDNQETEYVEVSDSTKKAGRYVLRVEGDSMIDAFINEDDYVVIEEIQELPNNQIIVAQLNDQAYIKRLIKRSNGQIILRSENPDYDDIFVKDGDTFDVKGKVVQVIRNYG